MATELFSFFFFLQETQQMFPLSTREMLNNKKRNHKELFSQQIMQKLKCTMEC